MLNTRRLFQTVLLGALFALALRNVADGDFWWHLRTGEYILDTQSIPHQDIFSYTRAGQEWVTHEWLSQVLMAALFRLGGFPLLIFTFAGIIAASFYIAFMRSAGNLYLSAAAALLGALSTAALWDARPQMISLLLTSIWLWLLDRYRHDEETRTIWLLVPLMALWVNLHGSFPLGVVLAGIYLVGALGERVLPALGGQHLSRRGLVRLAGIIVLLLLVIPLNPNGARMYTYPFETLNDPLMQAQIVEWQSPDFHRIEMLPLLFLILALFAAIGLGRRRPTLAQVLLLVATLFEALRSIRLVPLFALVAIPILGEAGPIAGRVALEKVRAAFQIVNAAVIGVLLVALALYAGAVAQNQSKTEAAYFPVKAVELMAREKWQGAIFNQYEWGGYLAYHFYPTRQVFIDGRADVYGRLMEDYLTVYRASAGWKDILTRYQVGLVLVVSRAPLAAALADDPAWQKVFEDERAVVFQLAGASAQ